jgi:phage gp16-like protein
MSKLARDHRNADLAAIHIAVLALGWSDEEYRGALLAQTGKTTSAALDAEERQAFLGYLRRSGWQPKTRMFTQADKIAWLWRKLGQAGALRDPSPAALMTLVGRVAGMQVSHLKFLPVREASKVMEALKAMLARAHSKAQPQ